MVAEPNAPSSMYDGSSLARMWPATQARQASEEGEMERSEFDAMTAADARVRAEHESDELHQSPWLQLAHEIEAGDGDTAGDLPGDRTETLYHMTGASR
jgi:hypothetical protein